MKHLLFLFLFQAMIPSLCATDLTPIQSVAERVAPWLAGKLQIQETTSCNGKEVFEIRTRNNRLEIKASSVPAAGMALNYYLKYYCHCHYSLRGNNMKEWNNLPAMSHPIKKECRFERRHFLNLCTQNYSASFWDWNDWEKLLDYMVLNGVNMAFSTVGMEQVWYNVLRQFKYSEKEILDFLPGPAFNAWHLMGNHEGWGGPITQNLIRKRCDLEQKIVKRMRELGIEPIFMSFYGMVPTSLSSKYPTAKIIDQGKWAGGFQRPSILLTDQELFDEIADAYYKEVIRLYGNFKYWAGEPFHEGGQRKGIDVSEFSLSVLKKLREYSPQGVWVLQGWNGNPSHEFLSSMNKENDVLIIDMKGESAQEWEKTKGYYGYPYLWGVVEDFGGKPGLHGKLNRFAEEPFRAQNSAYGKNMKGIAVSPESVLNNPVNWDLLLEQAWQTEPTDVDSWIEHYAVYRYGQEDENMKSVWKILLNTAYSSSADSINISPVSKILPPIGGGSTVICAPPALNLKHTSSWDNSILFYDYRKLKKIIPFLLQAIEKFENVDAFRYDAVDFTRQIIANEFRNSYYEFNYAVKNKDVDKVKFYARQMTEQLKDMDKILSLHRDFMVSTWINSAKAMAKDRQEAALLEKNARALITYWGPDKSTTDLRDYAHKEWNGLVADVYLPRWMDFFNYQINMLEGKKATRKDYVAMEIAWSKEKKLYLDTPNPDFKSILTRTLRKYN